MIDPNDLRTAAHIGLVQSVNDAASAQTATVQTHDGVVRANVEIHQPFGFASSPPIDGAIMLVIAVGGDAGQFVGLPAANPSARMGVAAGEACVYAADGTRIHCRAGGIIEIWAGNALTIHAPAVAIDAPNGVSINATAGAVINGPLHVTGAITCESTIDDATGSVGTV